MSTSGTEKGERLGNEGMLVAEAVVSQLTSPGLGYERVELIPRSTYRENSTIIVAPTRGAIHARVVQAWQSLMAPMNAKKAFFLVSGAEVGDAYTSTIQGILGNPDLSSWHYVLTLEDDVLPPPDAHIRLLEAIENGPYDAVSGIYWTKGDYQMPMAYGDPKRFAETGVLDFRPLDIADQLKAGEIVPVNGIAMGCSLYRMSIFRDIEPPHFVTVSDWDPGKGARAFTQDLHFCEKAVRAGKKFAVDMRVKCGHLDVQTGIVY